MLEPTFLERSYKELWFDFAISWMVGSAILFIIAALLNYFFGISTGWLW